MDTHRSRYSWTAKRITCIWPQRREIDMHNPWYVRTAENNNSQTAAEVRTRHAPFVILLNEKNMAMPNLRDCSRYLALPSKSLKSPQSGTCLKNKESCERSEDSRQNIEFYARGNQVSWFLKLVFHNGRKIRCKIDLRFNADIDVWEKYGKRPQTPPIIFLHFKWVLKSLPHAKHKNGLDLKCVIF